MRGAAQHLNLTWSDQLESLADQLFDFLDHNPRPDPLQPECIVVNSPTIEHWLRHRFVLDRRGQGRQRVLANWDVLQLYPFVNDWLARMTQPNITEREARRHPYSIESLQWRLFTLLNNPLLRDYKFQDLRHYCAEPDGALSPVRRFGLARLLANLFDDYQVYRPEMLTGWQTGRAQNDVPPWQPALWKKLIQQEPNSYLAAFNQIQTDLNKCDIQSRYCRVTVFGISVMPPVYLHFLQHLAKLLPVHLYAFNPCRELWDNDLTRRDATRIASRLQGVEENQEHLDTGNPLLSALGKGCQSYLAEMLDRTDGQINELFGKSQSDTLLHQIQADLRDRFVIAEAGNEARPAISADDRSIQIQIAHSPLREVEILRDFLLDQFASRPGLQPRHIQVLVSDLPTYVPYIQAVFDTRAKSAPSTIPIAISDRSLVSTSPVSRAFLTLLDLHNSRLHASDILDVFETEAVSATFGLDAPALSQLRVWIDKSAVRWGLDADHFNRVGLTGMDDTLTWQRAMDRLLIGYATAPADTTGKPQLVHAGSLGDIASCPSIEGSTVTGLGQFLQFIERIRDLVQTLRQPRPITEWRDELNRVVDTFFHATPEAYRDIAMLRRGIEELTGIAEAASCVEPLPADVLRDHLAARLDQTEPSRFMFHNAVVFSPLRAMRATPRPVLCLLGMSDGVFPRSDRRPQFDLIRRQPLRADRSHRKDDRLAFLESIMSARDTLYVSYVGRTDKANEKMPPSTVVSELKDYILQRFNIPAPRKSSDGQTLQYFETLHHLQPFHPDYFTSATGLFSRSTSNCEAAQALQTGSASVAATASSAQPDAGVTGPVSLDDLLRFFLNPARAYYQSRLQVRFNDPTDQALRDHELFTTTGLDKYGLTDALLQNALDDVPPDTLRQIVSQQALLPLGEPGKAAFDKQLKAVAAFLNDHHVLKDLAPNQTVRDVIKQLRDIQPQPVTIQTSSRPIKGFVPALERDGIIRALSWRFASIKPKDELRAWISHLFACAACRDKPVLTVILGADQNRPTTKIIPRIGSDKAVEHLSSLVKLLADWQHKPMPFAPATSYAFIEKQRASKSESFQEEALAEADKKWRPNQWSGGDSNDLYLFRAFGPEGPMTQPEFSRVAGLVFDQLFLALHETAP